MSTNHVDLVSAVSDVLDSVNGINSVYTYVPSTRTNYPTAIVKQVGFDNTRESKTLVRRVHHIAVFLLQEVSDVGFGTQKAARVFRELLDEVVTEFDSDITLGGTCLLCTPERADEPSIIDSPVTAMMVRMLIDCEVEIHRSTRTGS